MPAHAGEHRKFIDRRPIAPCRFYIYIASLLNRHGISCNPCHAVKARHCLVCHATPRVMVPDSRGCGSVRVKRRNTLCLGDCQENTTLSGGDQPPSPRKSSGLVDDCRLRPVCYAHPLVGSLVPRYRQENSISHCLQIPAFRLWNRIFRDASRHWDLLWMSGICSWLFAAKAENNQLRGISGLVSRLYLGFYIPMRIDRFVPT